MATTIIRKAQSEITSYIRCIRTSCVELAMPSTAGNFVSFEKTVEYVSNLDKVLLDMDESMPDSNFIKMFKEFSETKLKEINEAYTSGKTEYIQRIKDDLKSCVEKVAEKILPNANDRQKQRYETTLSHFSESLSGQEYDIRQTVNRVFTTICNKSDVPKLFTPEIEKFCRILESYFTFTSTITPLNEKLSSLVSLMSAPPPSASSPQKENNEGGNPFLQAIPAGVTSPFAFAGTHVSPFASPSLEPAVPSPPGSSPPKASPFDVDKAMNQDAQQQQTNNNNAQDNEKKKLEAQVKRLMDEKQELNDEIAKKDAEIEDLTTQQYILEGENREQKIAYDELRKRSEAQLEKIKELLAKIAEYESQQPQQQVQQQPQPQVLQPQLQVNNDDLIQRLNLLGEQVETLQTKNVRLFAALAIVIFAFSFYIIKK